MFGSIGGPEILFIFIVALLVFGPRRLPEIGKKIGGAVRELRRATGDFRNSMEREIGFDPIKGVEQARRARRDILTTVSDPIRDVASGTVALARDAKEEASKIFKGGWIEREYGGPDTRGSSKDAAAPPAAVSQAGDGSPERSVEGPVGATPDTAPEEDTDAAGGLDARPGHELDPAEKGPAG